MVAIEEAVIDAIRQLTWFSKDFARELCRLSCIAFNRFECWPLDDNSTAAYEERRRVHKPISNVLRVQKSNFRC